jgi:hypothetical protein
MHGMPLAMNMKLNDAESYPGWEWLKEIPTLSPRQVRSKPFDTPREIVCLVFFYLACRDGIWHGKSWVACGNPGDQHQAGHVVIGAYCFLARHLALIVES